MTAPRDQAGREAVARIPFAERKTRWRGLLDLLLGAYPGFTLGLPVRAGLLPVFHFHDVGMQGLQAQLEYLAANGYRTLDARELADHVSGACPAPARSVVLTFDDAWCSLHAVVLPLLRRLDMRAVTYVAPGRIGRPESAGLLCSWEQLRECAASGHIDIQSHTYSHGRIPVGSAILRFARPGECCELMDWPLGAGGFPPEFMRPDEPGFPVLPTRSRMSDACAFWPDPDAYGRVREAAGRGDVAVGAFPEVPGRRETADERDTAIRQELTAARQEIEARIPGTRVHQVCFPWAVAGQAASALVRVCGYESAVADRVGGVRGAVAGGDSLHIMRLRNEFLMTLPGRGRVRHPPWARHSATGYDR